MLLGSLPANLRNAEGTDAFQSGGTHERFLWDECIQHLRGSNIPTRNQGMDDCVGVAFASALEYLQCFQIVNNGRKEKYAEISSESIYGLSRVEVGGKRGVNDVGSNGTWATGAIRDWGVLQRDTYDGIDLVEYDAQIAARWGREGLPPELEQVARQHTVSNCTKIESYEQAANFIRSGYPVTVGTVQRFPSPAEGGTRDQNGFLQPNGPFNPEGFGHCMLFIGVRVDPPGLCCLNSWGDYPGGQYPDENMPKGAFWVSQQVATWMLTGTADWLGGQPRFASDAWALSLFEGFPSFAIKFGP
jgi:hypothetical protein